MGLGKHVDVLNLKSNAAIVVDQLNQEVVFEKHADAVLPIASITKLMTAMTVLDSRLNLDEILKINDEDVAIYHKSRLTKGTELTRREALLLALMSSENRAAYTLGRNYPGGIDAFMTALNRKAKEIGMLHSSFEDPTGLTSKNVSSPEDLALMVHAASQYPMIREFSTTPEYSKFINNRMQDFISSNRLVRSGNMLIGLQKTGYISEAGRCLVMQAFVNNKPYIMVFLDSQGSQSRFADAVRVKQWIDEQPEVKATRKLALKGSSTINPGNLMPTLSNSTNPAPHSFSHQTIESLLQNTN
jgi:D-alanyl-D-alanine endopeptidase (penicillin-binding protein 7)